MLHLDGRPSDFSWRMSARVHQRFIRRDSEQENQCPADDMPNMMRL
jgi:hypothetical protein